MKKPDALRSENLLPCQSPGEIARDLLVAMASLQPGEELTVRIVRPKSFDLPGSATAFNWGVVNSNSENRPDVGRAQGFEVAVVREGVVRELSEAGKIVELRGRRS